MDKTILVFLTPPLTVLTRGSVSFRGLYYFSQDLFKYILPSGVPRSSFIVIAGDGGSGKSVIVAHIVKDFIEKKEPVIYVALDDDPLTILSQLSSFGVDSEKHCNEKTFILLDGFSYIAKTRRPVYCVEDEVNPENPDTVVSALSKVVEKYRVENTGLIIIDSLNESMVTLDPTRFVKYVKTLRASFSKARGILTIATLHTSTNSFKEYLLTIEHLVDGIVETSALSDELAQHIPMFVRQISVRKMKGVESKQGWVLYGIDKEGLKPVILKITRS